MIFDGTNINRLGLMGIALGQEDQAEILPIESPEAPSYQEVYSRLFSSCVGMVGPETCHRLLGYRPFICPSPTLTQRWWFWLGMGALGGAVVGKFLA